MQETTARVHALEAHAGFMAAEPPGDLHRRNVLAPGATHVGIGLFLSERQFRLVEVLASRHVQVLPTAPTGEPAPGFELTSDDTHLFAKVGSGARGGLAGQFLGARWVCLTAEGGSGNGVVRVPPPPRSLRTFPLQRLVAQCTPCSDCIAPLPVHCAISVRHPWVRHRGLRGPL